MLRISGSGCISDDSCCGCSCCGYSGFSFSSPNASVSISDTYAGISHSGYGNSIPGTNVPNGTTTLSIIEKGEPNFSAFDSVDVGAHLPPPPKVAVPEVPDSFAASAEPDNIICAAGKGIAQGGANIVNGLQDIGIELLNLGLFGGYNLTSWAANQFGAENPYVAISSPDWSRGLITEEAGEEGTWTDSHGWSKFAGANGVVVAGGAAGLAGTEFGGTTMSQLPKTLWNGLKSGASGAWKKFKGWWNGAPKTETSVPGYYRPPNPLPQDKYGNKIPSSQTPHTQLGTREGTRGEGTYTQAREFGENGEVIRDIHFTDHNQPRIHPNPHQHRYTDNSTGGTRQRGKAEPLD